MNANELLRGILREMSELNTRLARLEENQINSAGNIDGIKQAVLSFHDYQERREAVLASALERETNRRQLAIDNVRSEVREVQHELHAGMDDLRNRMANIEKTAGT